MKSIPDIILYNGNIQTQGDDHHLAQAIAISGNQILSLGSDKDVLLLPSNHTRVIDLNKRLVLPGFIDTHFHFYEWAVNYDSIDFSNTGTFAEMEEAVAKKATAPGKGNWVLGQVDMTIFDERIVHEK